MAILDYESNEVNPLAAWLQPNASAYLSSVQQRPARTNSLPQS